MKNKMPSEGLRLGRDSGSILCDTLKKWRFRTGWGGGSKSKNAGREFHLISIAKIRNFRGTLSVFVCFSQLLSV